MAGNDQYWLWIEPLDVMFFRDSKPFTAGESFHAKSAFPPTPFPFVGAIRSRVLADILPLIRSNFQEYKEHITQKANHQLAEIVAVLGNAESYGRLELRGPFLARRMLNSPPGLFFPVPFDLFEKHKLNPLDKLPSDVQFSPPSEVTPSLQLLWSRESLGKELKDILVSASGLKRYLLGEMPRQDDLDENFFQRELRVGIALEPGRRTTKEGMFYMPEMLRLDRDAQRGQAGFMLEVRGLSFANAPIKQLKDYTLQEGLLQLGGESRAARYERIDRNPLEELVDVESQLQEQIKCTKHFKLYFASPAIFKQGWLPDFIDPNSLIGGTNVNTTSSKIKLQLISAAIGKAVPIGGWDLAKNAPKPLLKAVPPGSVYFFSLVNGDVNDLFKALHCNCKVQEWAGLSNASSLAQIGFGLTFIGRWDYV